MSDFNFFDVKKVTKNHQGVALPLLGNQPHDFKTVSKICCANCSPASLKSKIEELLLVKEE